MLFMALLKEFLILVAVLGVLGFFLGSWQLGLSLKLLHAVHCLVGLFYQFDECFVEFVLATMEYLDKSSLVFVLVGSTFNQLHVIFCLMEVF